MPLESGMRQDWKAWEQQFGNNFGAKELLRFLGVLAGWLFLGLGISLVTRDYAIFFPFLITAFAFPFACMRWKPAYMLLRMILGNENIPIEPRPHRGFGRSGRPIWWTLSSGIWLWLLVFLLIYLVIRLLAR